MQTKDRIVETASKLFYEQGYNSTGINQVIKEAGVAKASLYAHFSSKEELLKEYLQKTAITTNQILQQITHDKQTPKEKVLGVFDFLTQFSNQTCFNGCHFQNVLAEVSSENIEVKSIIRNQKNRIRQLFVEILKPLNKEELADEFYILFEGAIISSKVHEDLWAIKTTRKIVEKLF
ncbi:MAG: TetR/AcrR family transcriptional regulator [Ferruginibacter sp.]|nr:TetR/AcrR family transcriptional regulator [Ferruginibacter sp.]